MGDFFEQRLAVSLGDATMHLAIYQNRVQDRAAIIDCDVSQHCGRSRLGVDLDNRDVCAEWECRFLLLEDAFGVEPRIGVARFVR